MKRAGKYRLISIVLAALIAAAGWAAVWLLGTADGARWVMNAVSGHTPVVISARQVEGRLFDALSMRGVRIVAASFQVEIQGLDYRWQPLRLLSGKLSIQELTLAGVNVQDNTPAGMDPDLVWPRISGPAGLIGGAVERLQVNGLTYRHLDREPIRLNAISSRVAFQQGELSLADLAVASPEGRVDGSITAGFLQPRLEMALVAAPTKPFAGMDALSLQGRFLSGKEGEQLAGSFTVTGSKGKVKSVELAGEAGMTRNAFNLRQLRLTAPGRQGTVSGAGSFTLTAEAPIFVLQLSAEGVDLSSELKRSTDLSGSLTLGGTSALYQGKFNLASRGKGWQTAQLSGSYRGDGGGVKLAALTGSLLSGSVQGNLEIGWSRDLSVRGTLHGRNLNPEGISPDWKGVIHFDLTGGIAWPNQAEPAGEVQGRLLSSRLHGQELKGEIRADFARGDIGIERMVLQGNGFDIGAEGSLGKRLAFHAQVGDLGRLIPRATGEIRTEGWMRWRDGQPQGAVTGRGENIAAAGLAIAGANLTASLGEGKGEALEVALKLQKASYGRFRADSVNLNANGTALSHTAHAALNATEAAARISFAGAYDRGRWQGEIVRFSGRDGIGRWDLEAPVRLSVDAGSIALAPFVLNGAQPERMEIAGNLTREPLGGSLRLAFHGLNLARANPWLPVDLQLGGRLAGRIEAGILPGNRLDMKGQTSFIQGKIRRGDGNGKIEADISKADLTWRWQGGLPDSAAQIRAGRLVIAGRSSLSGRFSGKGRSIALENGLLTLDGGEHGLSAGIAFGLAGGGVVKGVFSSAAPARLVAPETGDVSVAWDGVDPALFRPWLPGGVGINGILSGRAAGRILPGDGLDLSGRISLARGRAFWKKERISLDASLRTAELSWGWRGALPSTAASIGEGRLVLAGQIAASGHITVDGRTIGVEQGTLSLDGNERGIHTRVDLTLAGGGSLNGSFTSSSPASLAVPSEGEAVLAWTGIDLALLRPWLPREAGLEGSLAGRVTGHFFPGERLAIRGETALSGGKLRWSRPEGEIQLNLRAASVSLDWQEEALRGAFALRLTDQGEVNGDFRLPIPARLPVAADKQGTLTGALKARVLEKGIFTSLFPEIIRESGGEMETDLLLGGTWDQPSLTGSLKLAKAQAYLPTAGIHLSDLLIAMHLEKGLLSIDSFRAVSGPGHIEGTAVVRLKGWQVEGFNGRINGERFQLVYLPELQILGSPRLTFEGSPEKLTIHGEMRLPEMFILGPPARTVVLASPDVILEGATKPAEKGSPLVLDVQVRLELGESVFVKLEGIEARLDGGIDLVFQSLDKITSRGEIKVVKGRYSAYGVNLEIVRGRLFYAGGPIGQPTLDILALRRVGDVRAGISAGGILRVPLIRLYSEPMMPDVDILGYIVFGRPLGNRSDSEQAGMLAQAAGVLLSKGQSVVLQEQIKSRLGLSTLEIQSGGAGAAGRLGYREMVGAPPGVAPAAQPDDLSQTMLTVGKYLTPELYFSYGRSLFTGGNLFRLRYDLFKGWQIETQTGSESGVDLYYKIEFD